VIEYFAGFIIVLASIKIVVLLIKPQSWIKLTKKLYVNPQLTSMTSILLAAVVLYFLIKSGLNIVQILAVTLFIALLMLSGIAPYAKQFISWSEKQDMRKIVKDTWLNSIIWVLLLFWGAVELFRAYSLEAL